MPRPSVSKTTALLRSVRLGDAGAADVLLPHVYDELHEMAARMMGGECVDHTLQPTALLHEAYLRLVDQTRAHVNDRVHFVRIAAQAMRRVLVDHSRIRNAEKRGGQMTGVALDPELPAIAADASRLLAVHESIERLSVMDAQLAQIVELRFFGGMAHAEIAKVIGTSLRSVERAWRLARAWLLDDLRTGESSGH